MKKVSAITLGFISTLLLAIPIVSFSGNASLSTTTSNETNQVLIDDSISTNSSISSTSTGTPISPNDLQIGITISQREWGVTSSTFSEIMGHLYFDVYQLYDLNIISLNPDDYLELPISQQEHFWMSSLYEIDENLSLKLEAELYNPDGDLLETFKIFDPHLTYYFDYADFNAGSNPEEYPWGYQGVATEDTRQITTFFLDFTVPTSMLEDGYSIVVDITEFKFIDPETGIHYEITIDNFYYYDNSAIDFYHEDDLKPYHFTIYQSFPDNLVLYQNGNYVSLYDLPTHEAEHNTGSSSSSDGSMMILWIVIGVLGGTIAVVSIVAWVKKLNRHKQIADDFKK